MAPAARKPTRKSPAYSAPALEKGLEIIELLASMSHPMSTREIGDRLGRSKGEIFRMVYVLVERGYLSRDPVTDELLLTNKLFELGMRTPGTRELVEVAVPAMERLSDVCDQSAHLVVFSGGETVVVASTSGQSEITFTLRLGYRRPALEATSGQIIIAFQNTARRVRMIEDSIAAGSDAVDGAAIEVMLNEIAARGYLVAESHDVLGVTDIGAPILDRNGRAVASIVVPCLNRRGWKSKHNHVLKLLLETCDSIGQAMG